MASPQRPRPEDTAETRSDEALIELALRQGLRLVERELENGQRVWSWEGRDRSWDFLARQQAIAYMADRFR